MLRARARNPMENTRPTSLGGQYSSGNHAEGKGEEPYGEYKANIAGGSLEVSQVQWPDVVVES